jgi:hypothetical protein
MRVNPLGEFIEHIVVGLAVRLVGDTQGFDMGFDNLARHFGEHIETIGVMGFISIPVNRPLVSG